jgi:hypothetical protein
VQWQHPGIPPPYIKTTLSLSQKYTRRKRRNSSFLLELSDTGSRPKVGGGGVELGGGRLREKHREITKSVDRSVGSIKKTNFQVTEQAICSGQKKEQLEGFVQYWLLLVSLTLCFQWFFSFLCCFPNTNHWQVLSPVTRYPN